MAENKDDFNWIKIILGVLFLIGVVFLITLDSDDHMPLYDHSFSYIICYILGGIVFIILLMNYDKFT